MCGRYKQTADRETLEQRFGAVVQDPMPSPRYNLAPSQEALVAIQEQERKIVLMRWGLVPAWAKDPAMGNKLINARAETAAEKPAFRQSFRRRRCLVLADGFYEWRPSPGKGQPKVPVLFQRRDREPFAMAGLWDSWHDPEEQQIRTFTILTTEANNLVKQAHDRMPVILTPEHEGPWLDLAQHDPRALAALLEPLPAEFMESYEVSPAINSPAHEGPELIAPLPDNH